MTDRQDMTCGTCAFYEPPKPRGGTVGECHRYPPQMLARGIGGSFDEGHGSFRVEEADSNWPLVADEDWCGEWRPK